MAVDSNNPPTLGTRKVAKAVGGLTVGDFYGRRSISTLKQKRKGENEKKRSLRAQSLGQVKACDLHNTSYRDQGR
jgi:hypothetical protein